MHMARPSLTHHRRFSMLEVMAATVVFGMAFAPMATMIVDAQLRTADAQKHEAALALADDMLTWAVVEADTGAAPPSSYWVSGLRATVAVEEASRKYPNLELVTATVTWEGQRGTEKVELKTLRMKP